MVYWVLNSPFFIIESSQQEVLHRNVCLATNCSPMHYFCTCNQRSWGISMGCLFLAKTDPNCRYSLKILALIYSDNVTGSWICPLNHCMRSQIHTPQKRVFCNMLLNHAVFLYLWLLSLRKTCGKIIFSKSCDTAAFHFAKIHLICRHSIRFSSTCNLLHWVQNLPLVIIRKCYWRIFYKNECPAINCSYGKVFLYLWCKPLKNVCGRSIFRTTMAVQFAALLKNDLFSCNLWGSGIYVLLL